jgi:hypothetical protein
MTQEPKDRFLINFVLAFMHPRCLYENIKASIKKSKLGETVIV